jgi:periplasmic divalent cation tolerance protein
MITLIQTTSDSRSELDELVQALVELRLVACGQVEGPITSTYVWEEEVKSAEEFRLTLKTVSEHMAAIEAYITEHHSYDLPEIISFEVTVSSEYQKWVEEETSR